QNILDGLAFLSEGSDRVRLDQAFLAAEALLEGLRSAPGIEKMELCGSLRRRKETIRDIDILVSARDARPIMEHFTRLPSVRQIVAHGETKSSVVVDLPLGRGQPGRINADLRVVSPEQFPFALNYFTGSQAHNIAMRARAQRQGL